MKKFLSALIFMGLSMVSSFGQEQPRSEGPPDVTGSSGYSVGINTQFMLDGLFDQNTMTPLELMVRKRTKADQAMRARLGGMATHSNRINAEEQLESRQTNWNAAIGYEWHESLGKKFGFYYGVDVEAVIGNEKKTLRRKTFDTPIGDLNSVLNDKIREQTYSIKPLVGVTYHLTRSLYASAELRLKFAYRQNKRNNYWFHSTSDAPSDFFSGSYTIINNYQFDFSLMPLANIFIHLKL
nr:hypothetical protein [Cytophagales bacterium]